MASNGEALALQIASSLESSVNSLPPLAMAPKNEVVLATPKEIELPEQRGSEKTRDLKCKHSFL